MLGQVAPRRFPMLGRGGLGRLPMLRRVDSETSAVGAVEPPETSMLGQGSPRRLPVLGLGAPKVRSEDFRGSAPKTFAEVAPKTSAETSDVGAGGPGDFRCCPGREDPETSDVVRGGGTRRLPMLSASRGSCATENERVRAFCTLRASLSIEAKPVCVQ